MIRFGKLFVHIATTLAIVILALLVAVPDGTRVLAAAGITSDDFNRCTLNTAVWTFENPSGDASANVDIQPGDATFNIVVPSGEYTFSNTNLFAPRIMQKASDQSFEVEVKFNSPLGVQPADSWNIQGILVRDTTTAAPKDKWMRFELDANSNSINFYIAYIDENGVLHSIYGPAVISANVTASPLYFRVKYDQPLNQWWISYRLGDADQFHLKGPYSETGFTFNVTDIGVFAGTTGPGIGITSKVDYFKNVEDTSFTDDATPVVCNLPYSFYLPFVARK